MMTDPISDMLTRIRNATSANFKTVIIPNSKIKLEMVKILKEEGYINEYKIEVNSKTEKKRTIRVDEQPRASDKKKVKVKSKIKAKNATHINITLKYKDKQKVINGLRRISKPGLRVYVKNTEIPKVLGGLGISIISTSQGIMTDRRARKEQLGGEVLAFVW